ncbi:MAG: Gfo/Idh/MocA family oxidoreductase [Desulfobacterales bacterium]|nr:Gfo/Idh/MocA family oxidoreductase [Desulfobacterales bacterium]
MFRVSIIGARRGRNGIGEYIGKYFHQQGAEVTSVLGTTEETSRLASLALEKYGIRATPYTRFDEMVEHERPDAAVIASPSSTHFDYLVQSIELGLHVFCEKPLIWPIEAQKMKRIEAMFVKAREKGLTIAMNTQWPFAMKDYEKLCGKVAPEESDHFFIWLSPLSPGKEMIPESIPHALSLLWFHLGEGTLANLGCEWGDPGDLVVCFRYVTGTHPCEVVIKLVRKEKQPREFQFGFNHKIVTRKLDLRNYDIYFDYGDRRLKIEDPLKRSVIHYIQAAKERKESFMGSAHILKSLSLLREIYDQCRD